MHIILPEIGERNYYKTGWIYTANSGWHVLQDMITCGGVNYWRGLKYI